MITQGHKERFPYPKGRPSVIKMYLEDFGGMKIQLSMRAVRQHQSSDDGSVSANVSLSAGIEGEKKYSPPFGTTHCLGSLRSAV